MRIWDKLFDYNNKEIVVSILWLFQNMVADNKTIRDYIITSQIYIKILDLMNPETIDEDVAKNISTLISNVHKVGGSIEAPNYIAEKSTEIVCTLMKINNLEVQSDTMWAIANITNLNNSNIAKIILLSHTLEILLDIMKKNMDSNPIKCAFLKIIGNLTSGKDDIIDTLLHLGILNIIVHFLNDPIFSIRRETVWIFSNIAAGTKEHVKALINQGFLDLIKLKLQDSNLFVLTEAVWCISNCVSGSDLETKITLIAKHSILEILRDCLMINNEKIVFLALEALKAIFMDYNRLNFTDQERHNNLFVQQFISIGGADILERLQESDNERIAEEVYRLIKEYFPIDNK
jgi:importin subunit alpha-1